MPLKENKRVSRSANASAEKKNSPAEMAMLRSMPESLPAEAAVLGSMIVDPRCIGDVVEQIDRTAFYHSEHQLIFDAILALYERNRGEGIDGLLVRDELERHGQLEGVGGLAETIEIFWPTRAFRRVDFPELGRPIIAAVPYFIETNDTRKADRPSRKRIYSPDCAAAVDLFLTDIA